MAAASSSVSRRRRPRPGSASGSGALGPGRVHRRPEPGRVRGRDPRGRRAQAQKDPFPGPAALNPELVKRFRRGGGERAPRPRAPRLRRCLQSSAQREEAAAERAARTELMLPLEPGFLEPDPGQDSSTITQGDIVEAVDIASAAKHFELRLDQFGPYRIDYTRNGRHLLLGGRRGHVAALDWQTKQLQFEMNVMEQLNDVTWLHCESLLAVAQRRWLHVYDGQGLELSVLKSFPCILHLRFLPYHFLLAAASSRGLLQFLDVSVGQEVSVLSTHGGRPTTMEQNPSNAVLHVGHGNGTITLWSPSVQEPLVRMLSHRGAVRALAIDPSGTYMASAGLDRKVRLWDLRTYGALQDLVLPMGASHLDFSQRGLLAAACGDVVQVYKDIPKTLSPHPYLCHRPPGPTSALRFCPYEDVLGTGHAHGFTSILVPGAGEANWDALENNPYRSRKQRQEWEVKALLEKIPAELITLDPSLLGRMDTATLEQKREERIQRLGFDPQAKPKFKPRHRTKGSSGLRRKKKVAHEQQRAVIQKSVEQREQKRKEMGTPLTPKRGALERFKR
ncbi:WD repeat-containing protein 46 isoform X2 [Melopsittacus undulatus]|uniref:Uncharacterized protein n=1 Tax=Melopsittacus undulatus TaxID=13146 RepID=A0A8V5GWP8_MELUD|nr:WD repeat-containing protein 46 isoform X1 [Melopsittacus undulatus]XP_033928331.1 WD repeat-containing protein 46 isoform X2 [Melopsittacus undulatus]